ncbi:5-formyltetrahydrofolate cyclo-ligase [Avrilella dinanensis]|uniref:5-formyltetrahydrofolate cyclo-ligase n=1 Tax=Avrilella dinanensis TaxID=2008672 RepID=A0A2M9R4Q7_9FLAO|nr:5-formyltetrahydrofolate cyclo-ligase [Avrilella dinanensis]PJR03713.1 5-formyltetrahydrofolate cyclo-ligase [Avrilella dinanensis]
MNKKEIRTKYKTLRKQLSADEVEEMSLAIANQTLKSNIWNHQTYHIFLPIAEQKEVNTDYLLQILFGKDKNVVISRTDFSNLSMHHVLLTDTTTIRKNDYNIPEPIDGFPVDDQQIDVIFIPLLAYDKSGNRVGYGKGFYDNFLQKCRKDVIKIGLSFYPPEEEITDIRPEDIPLDMAVTPNEIFDFN